jgi:CheY-like chemotaxis protein
MIKVNTQKTVLVVEDEVCCREALRLMLESYGCRVLLASSCVEALILLRVHHKSIDLIMLDIMLPDKTGIDFLIEVRAKNILGNIPVIIQSSESNETIQEALNQGACGYIHKPHVKAEIFRIVKNLVKPIQCRFSTRTMACI